MQAIRVMSVVGARPNFMKIAPLVRAIEAFNARPDVGRRLLHTLVHTGQHYDADMSQTFFDALAIPRPDVELGVGSGTHAEQVGRTMIAFEAVLPAHRPDWVIVVGDVNATCACALTARKEGVKLAHIEAGLRSFDDSMPEEINRIVTDRLAHLLFTPDAMADANLAREGVDPRRVHRVGNIMIDTLEAHRASAERLDPAELAVRGRVAASMEPADAPCDGRYALLTLHRPSNVDHPDVLQALTEFFIDELAPQCPLVWSLHPRTARRLRAFGLWERVIRARRVWLLEPLGYLDMLRFNMGAAIVFTDSGGLQEECCVLGTPCVTLRSTTERPITLREHGGVSELAGNSVERIRAHYRELAGAPRRVRRPALWDGHTAERIVSVLAAEGGTA